MARARVIVTTCDKYLWLVKPFSYLFNMYWSENQPVLIAGYSPPTFTLPDNFTFHSISSEDYPVSKWSDGVIKLLQGLGDDFFIWMLEDMFINRAVDHSMIDSLVDYAGMRDDILRIDLTRDRLHAKDPRQQGEFDVWGRANLIESKPNWSYHISLQAGIWHRERLLELLQPGMTPWDFELQSSPFVDPRWKVLGTRQIPLQYALVSSQDPRRDKLHLGNIEGHLVDKMRREGML